MTATEGLAPLCLAAMVSGHDGRAIVVGAKQLSLGRQFVGSLQPFKDDLLEREGLCLGASSGVNVAGAIELAKAMGPGHTIVTILCDSGSRYLSTIFNDGWMRSKGFI